MNLLTTSYRAIIFCCISCQLILSAADAQEAKWDSTYRPDIYPSRVDLFNSFRHSKKDIVFLGNSITFWGEWSELLGSPHIKNRGIPGDITFGVLERLDEVINGQPAKVFILIGINDIARNIPDSVTIRNYKRMVERIKTGSPRTKIFFQTLLPTNSAPNKLTAYYHKELQVKKINAAIRDLTKEEHIGLIDLYASFADAEGNLPRQYTFDGVHLTKPGYDVWVDVLKKGKYLTR